MPDETTSSPTPEDTAIPQAPEAPISTPPEAVIVPAPVEAPVEPVPVLESLDSSRLGASGEAPGVQDASLLTQTRIEASLQAPISENINSASGHLGGNDPIEVAPAESIPSAPAVEAPVAVTEPVPAETPTPEPVPAETTQPTPAEPVIEETPVMQAETPAPAQIPEPVVAQVPVSAPTPELVTQAPTPPPVVTTPTPAQVVATAVAPVVANTIAQTFTKSMRELFTKALNARQNKKRKKLDRILSLFAKQTMITNNEVEELLHISDSTATRYLATLEKEGKLKQNTKKGHATSYSKI